MELNYLPINKENIKYRPEKFTIEIDETFLLFEISYNVVDDNFYFNLYQEDETPIVLGRKIVYGQDMLENIYDDYLPNDIYIIPEDFSGEARKTGITFDNFMKKVKPYIFTGSDS